MIHYLLVCVLGFFLTACSPSQPELHIYVWGDFIKPEVIDDFEAKFNCRVIVDTFDSNEAMYAKLKAGASGYDIIFPTGYILEIMEEQGMIHPLDKTLLPNLQFVDYDYLTKLREQSFENGVPYAVTFSGIGYRKDKVSNPISSWGIFGEAKLRGRMTMLNDIREALGAALRYHGYSINTRSLTEIQTAAEQLIAWKKNLAKFESEQYKNGLASAEYLVVQGYSGDIMQIIQEDEDVGFLLPVEGSIFSCDYIAIPKEAPALDLAHSFINYLLEPQVAADNMQHTFYRSPNKEAYAFLSENLRMNPALFPSEEFLEISEVIRNLGTDIQLYNKAWDYVKANYY